MHVTKCHLLVAMSIGCYVTRVVAMLLEVTMPFIGSHITKCHLLVAILRLVLSNVP